MSFIFASVDSVSACCCFYALTYDKTFQICQHQCIKLESFFCLAKINFLVFLFANYLRYYSDNKHQCYRSILTLFIFNKIIFLFSALVLINCKTFV